MKFDDMLQEFLNTLLTLPEAVLWLFFLAENMLITALVLLIGRALQKHYTPVAPSYRYTSHEWLLCGITNILNTAVTYAGFWLWKHHIISIHIHLSLYIIIDFIILFLAMDLLMYIFHFIIHKTFLYNLMHRLHHQAIDPKPIDLFVLHPVETISFGGLWLVLLIVYPFNLYAMILYLTVNVLFGMIGHLGLEPLSERLRSNPVLKYIGTSTFHHQHHQDIHHNFGFYTSIWDRLFGTLSQE